ncbi:Ankyrin repeats (3 copies) [Legionella pneumophila]|uniref:ankyrin repeat domain-containing protein n=1 Tax=Legionella pneumophila TaxID=446 RepID=UPI000696AB76|nr:ankyrin repeat domain-containing protein [Legionella pneumophila]HAT8816630.1 ankyrin repeat domain-containing protein [Legionella pneumophila subsp. pneumophila]MCZ4806229.1 ankyrin repeat domain-containing protein [Legionella pneumophila]MDW9180721.1 ankyrin repeat domain-containing protein [Legionella pneumophila]WAI79418.1 ankyrin repeat domain-containing protein [Legionella pneumophila]CZH48774.1 Ankyrin repeats (3 copies) [Legionella pneumophila]
MKRYQFKIKGYGYYIDAEQNFDEHDLCVIEKILHYFPHASKSRESIEKFLEFSLKDIPNYLLPIVANAFDSYGNTMLGIACEYGYSVEAVQKLIDMGANLNAPDHNMSKLPLHWAINNKMSFMDMESYDAVKVVECLLKNGAKTDITCYQNSTPLEYAKSRGFIAAASIIETYAFKSQSKTITSLSITGIFYQKSAKQLVEPKEANVNTLAIK